MIRGRISPPAATDQRLAVTGPRRGGQCAAMAAGEEEEQLPAEDVQGDFEGYLGFAVVGDAGFVISMGDDIRLLKNRFAKISQLSIMPPQRVRADQDEFLDMEAPNTW
ncbi:hypothetical protein EJB05_10023, partial [Eragrostis curvula]